MRREMPLKHRATLSETRAIADLLAQAPPNQRAEAFQSADDALVPPLRVVARETDD